MSLTDEFNAAADEWFALEPGSFPAVARPAAPGVGDVIAVRGLVPLPVLESIGFRRHEAEIKAALLILSQSPAARKLATLAVEAGYSIVVDPPVIGGAGAAHEAEAMGAADHVNKRINLRSGAAPESLALVLAHELAHIGQIVTGGLDIDIRHAAPGRSLAQLLAMEADARAREMQIALELAFAAKDDPAERLLFPHILDIAVRDIGTAMIGPLMAKALPRLPEIGPEKIMAGVFKSFYGSPSMRAHYEATILETLGRIEPAAFDDETLFKGGLAPAALIERLDAYLAPAYLAPQVPQHIDLAAPLFNSVAADTRDRIAALGVRRGDAADWQLPVYAVARTTSSTPGPKP